VIEQPVNGVLACERCNWYMTLIHTDSGVKIGYARETEEFTDKYAKIPRIEEHKVRIINEHGEYSISTVDHSDELAYDMDGSVVIPSKYRTMIQVESGSQKTDEYMRRRLGEYPEEVVNPHINISAGTPGWKKAYDKFLTRVDEPCGRRMVQTSRCSGRVRFQPAAIPVCDVRELRGTRTYIEDRPDPSDSSKTVTARIEVADYPMEVVEP